MIIALLWMPEAKHVTKEIRAQIGEEEIAQGAKAPVPRAIWGYALFALAAWTCVVTVQVVTSNILDARGLATAGQTALVINCCGIGTIICGLVFPRLVRLFKARLFGVAALLVVVGIVPCFLAPNAAVYAVGVFILGFGGSAFFTAAQNATGNIAPKSRVPFVSGIMTSMMNLGPFIGPYIFAGSMAALPSMGLDAIFPVLIGIGVVVAIIGLAHPMRALVLSPESQASAQSLDRN